MPNSIRRKSDRNLIIALTDDYLNVYSVRPEENLVDVIKLNGYVTEGIESSWSNLNYATLLDNYTRSRVHPDDHELFIRECGQANLIRILSNQAMFQGRYRVVENGATHYYSYKFVKVSGENEPLRAVAAFRLIDDLVAIGQKSITELEDIRNILDSSDMGTWHIMLMDGRAPRMTVDNKMAELLGLPSDVKLTEEEIYERWHSRIDINSIESVQRSVSIMLSGTRDENTYRWIHPILGERFVRCGGSAVAIPGGHILSGYHYDVTEQVKKDIRSKLIINSLARSFDFLIYIRLNSGEFISYDEIFNNEGKKITLSGDIHETLNAACDKHVSAIHRVEMKEFSDLSTINERMRSQNVLINQYKDEKEIWHEWSYIVAERNEDGSIKHLIWADRKIDDEKKAEIRRQQILEDNIAANKAKTMFLQNMSHEIRTPLNAMFGFAQLLGLPDGSWTDEEKQQYNAYIHNSFNMLDMLIGDIIDIADSEHGNYRINISDVHVNSVCRSALMSVEYRKPSEVNMYFTTDLPDDHVIKSDGRRVQQVLINYLTNACKHTEKGEIHLDCSSTEHPGKLTFSVTDTGSGVPPEMADLVFNRFFKINNFTQGSGLGLNICMMVASKLGGEVYLDKSHKNGARFVFVIDNE